MRLKATEEKNLRLQGRKQRLRPGQPKGHVVSIFGVLAQSKKFPRRKGMHDVREEDERPVQIRPAPKGPTQ